MSAYLLRDKRRKGVELPNELISEIILNLPLKYLLRYRVVCKEWRNIIDVVRSQGKLKKSAFIFYNQKYSGVYIVEEDEVGRPFNSKKRRCFHPNHRRLQRPYPYASGLVYVTPALHDHGEDLCTYIYDPATQIYLKLPPLMLSLKSFFYIMLVSGFGFDPTSKLFKVVQLIQYHSEPYTGSPVQEAHMTTISLNQKHQLFLPTFGEGSWQKLDNLPHLGHWTTYPSSSVQVNTSLHWFIRLKRWILVFHLTNNEFELIETPQIRKFTRPHWVEVKNLGLVSLRGCLAIYDFYLDSADIWIMEDRLMKASWTKIRFVYPVVPNVVQDAAILLISLSSNGEVLLLYDYKVLVSVNVDTGKWSPIQIREPFYREGPYCVYPYHGRTDYDPNTLEGTSMQN